MKRHKKYPQQKLEKIVEHSKKEMNDQCPYIFDCRGDAYTYEWRCFGRYNSCEIYKKLMTFCPFIYGCKKNGTDGFRSEDWRCSADYKNCQKYKSLLDEKH